MFGLTGNDEGIADRIGDEFGGFFLTGHGGGVGGGVFSTLVILERVRIAGGDGTDGELGFSLNGDEENIADRIGDEFGKRIGVSSLDNGLADSGTG